MKTRRIGIIMNGVTGRMGTNQHLVRSILEIRRECAPPFASSPLVGSNPGLRPLSFAQACAVRRR